MSKNYRHWLDIIGVTEQGVSALSPAMNERLQSANTVFGPKRFLENLPEQGNQEHIIWQSPFSAMIELIKGQRGSNTVILAGGDPNWFGIGATLARHLSAKEYAVHPAPSAFQLAAAAMHWPLQNVQTLSLHGRSIDLLQSLVQPGARLLTLTSDHATLEQVAKVLCNRGFSKSVLTILENLGGESSQRSEFLASEYNGQAIGDFYTLAIECVADIGAQILPCVPGLPDAAFEHDGQLTKRHVRAATLALLAPTPNALLWDVGAGSGSIAIEWMRTGNGAKAICFEKSQARCARIALNCAKLGVPDLKVIKGEAIDVLIDQPEPDAVFLGGDVAHQALFDICWKALKPGGRFVANAVTVESQEMLVLRHKTLGGELNVTSVSEHAAIGSKSILRPNLPVMQWSVVKHGIVQ